MEIVEYTVKKSKTKYLSVKVTDTPDKQTVIGMDESGQLHMHELADVNVCTYKTAYGMIKRL